MQRKGLQPIKPSKKMVPKRPVSNRLTPWDNPKTAAAAYDKAHCTEPLGIRYQRSAVSTRTFQTDTKPHIMSVSDLLPVNEHNHTAFKTRCINNKTENALLRCFLKTNSTRKDNLLHRITFTLRKRPSGASTILWLNSHFRLNAHIFSS
jgi:hypothetical protein